MSTLALRSVSLDDIPGYDAVALGTAHPGIDYRAVLEQSAVLVDLRGITRKLQQAAREPQLVAAA